MDDSADMRPVRVDLLASPQSTPTALYGFLELFNAVGVAWSAVTGEVTGARRMNARIVAADAEPFLSPIGVPIAPQAAIADDDSPDAVIVTDLDLSGGLPEAAAWDSETEWLRARHRGGAVICSVCTGAVLLAEAGLLDGLEATTHWSAAPFFGECFPAVQLRPERILCPAGAEHRIVTSGGPGSWEDLALYLVARFAGEAEARRIAKIFVLGDRSEGQLPFSAMGRPRNHGDAAVDACQAWIAANHSVASPVTEMVRRSALPERSFKRRFRTATGYTPVEYVQALRVEEAKRLLETSSMAVEEIAFAVGYEDAAFFRRLFRRRTGITPARYRQRFRVPYRVTA